MTTPQDPDEGRQQPPAQEPHVQEPPTREPHAAHPQAPQSPAAQSPAAQSPAQEPPSRQSHVPPPPPLSESELSAVETGGRPPVPREVNLSFWIWIGGAALSVLGALYSLTQRDEIAEAFREAPQTKDLSPAEFDAAINASLMFAVVIGIVFAGLYVLFALQVRAGKNWARVVLTVLTALSLISALLTPSVLGLATALISVVAVVVLYMPNANAYFNAVKRSR